MEGLAMGRMLVTAIGVQSSSTIPQIRIPIRSRRRTSSSVCDDGSSKSGRLILCCNKEDGQYNDGHDSSSSSSSSSVSSSSSSSEVIRLRRENTDLRASLGALSKSLASISAVVAEVSRAVQLVANAVDCGEVPFENGVVSIAEDSLGSAATQESPAPLPTSKKFETQDPVQAKLMKQNMIAHNLAYKIQQAFIQARIEGLGKPFQLAAEDFVAFCLEAHAMGIGLKELQLQLILLEGSLSGAFAMRNQRYSNDSVMSEESRVRSSWVRLVYTTLAEVKERRSRVDHTTGDTGKEREQPDPSDSFVKELVTMAFEQGYDLERVKLEQSVSGPVSSGAIKTMRQSSYLVLLTLQKTTNDAL